MTLPAPPEGRLDGIREQLARALLHFREGQASTDPTDQFRRFIAAVYPARAMVELMMEAGEHDEVRRSAREIDSRMAELLPRYYLLQRIRIHDFHRHGVLLRGGFFFAGPIKISARGPGSGIKIQLTPTGPETTIVGQADVKWNRPLQMQDGRILDEDSGEWLTLEQILGDYLGAATEALAEFEKLLKVPEP